MVRRLAAIVAGCLAACAAAPVAAGADVFTPVTVSTIGPSTMPVRGADGRFHVVYELELVNGKPAPATLREVDVLDARHRSRVLARFRGAGLTRRLFTTLPSPAGNATIASGEMRFLFVELAFRRRAGIPHHVVHRLRLRGSDNPGATKPAPMTYVTGRFDIRDGRPLVLSAPLRGRNWVATNGCCRPTIVHRGSIQTVNGGFFDAQRFAIDWMRLNADGRFYSGDGSDVRQYADYGAPVRAVAGGVVVSAVDTLEDQTPGRLPPVASLTLRTVDGNHIVLALGHGLYAFYAHLRHGSVRVHPGQRVRRGQVLGELGNTGNTSAPHLHFHLMRGPSTLGSDGVPYVLRRFSLTGHIPVRRFDAAENVEGTWNQDRFAPRPRRHAFPMDLDIVTLGR